MQNADGEMLKADDMAFELPVENAALAFELNLAATYAARLPAACICQRMKPVIDALFLPKSASHFC